MNDLSQARKLIKECKDTQNSYLDLGKCGISDLNELPELFECEHIETLVLSNAWVIYDGENNKIPFIPKEISNLKKLTNLIISGDARYYWKTSDISFLENLTGLQTLRLSGSYISNYSFLSNLTGLQTLDIIDNQISDISFLSGLTGLQTLNLSGNNISDISFLSNLTGLQTLNLRTNSISDISFLSNLAGLQTLNLRANRISDISFLSNLAGLQTLYLSGNNISDISFLSNLTMLQTLNLRENQISDISSLENLIKLENLDLKNNKIKEIPKSIFQLNMKVKIDKFDLTGLCLYANPIESPPFDIVKQGKQSVLNWYEAKKKKLNEIKIIFIGEPKAGKTSLLKRLKDNSFNEKEAQTDGVNVEDMAFGKCGTFKEQVSLHDITGHFWDFGGQEIMYATHQFFLTKRSVYVLVLDARIDKNNTMQIRDWVKRIRATGGESPIIVAANQIDVNPNFGFVNERELQDEFPQIKCFIKISCKTEVNIDLLKNKLAEIIPTAELFITEIDERWITIKNRLQEETKKEYYLSEKRFIEICNEAKIEGQDRENVINLLHDLGLVLHFNDLDLAEYYVLDPYWITYGTYKILTSKYAGDKKGIGSMDELESIINEEEANKEGYHPANYKKIEYFINDRRFLIDILNQFKLCFRIQGGSQFIIPDILDTVEPMNITDPIRLSDENVQFVYEYDYLPNSVMPNVMVETHNIITDMWRTGCVLHNDGCKALITTYRKRISIFVTGEYKKKREFMAIIRFIIDSINQKLSSQVVRLIPLPGVKDGFAEYEILLTREKKGKTDYIHDEDKPTEKKITISELLDGIPSENEVRFSKKQFKEIITKLDGANNKLVGIKEDTERIKGDTEKIKNKLDSHFEYLLALTNNSITKDEIQEAIKEISSQQTTEIMKEIVAFFKLYEGVINDKLNEKLKGIYNDLKETEDVQAKLALSIPFINMLGIKFEVEFDVKKWAKKMYEKFGFIIFKLLGTL